jgi:hypothetical protein
MTKLSYIIPLLLFSVSNCIADETGLRSSVWTGSIKLPGKDKESALVQVSSETDTDIQANTHTTMYVDETPLDFIDLKIRKDSLHFSIDTGTMNQCILKRQASGEFTGYCEVAESTDVHGRIELSMQPPKDSQNKLNSSTEKGTGQ